MHYKKKNEQEGAVWFEDNETIKLWTRRKQIPRRAHTSQTRSVAKSTLNQIHKRVHFQLQKKKKNQQQNKPQNPYTIIPKLHTPVVTQ